MRIEDVRTYEISGEGRRLQVVHVTTDEGLDGVGEAGLNSSHLAVAGAVAHFRDQLIGEDASRIEHFWQHLHRGTFFRGGVVFAAALSAIDIALWDLQAKALGVPLYRLFGGRVRDKVRIYRHLHQPLGVRLEDLAADAKAKVAAGDQVIRMHVSETGPNEFEQTPAVNRAIEEFAAVREAVGPDVDLVIDAHQRLTPPAARRLCRQLEPYDPYFVEDPIRSDSPDLLRELRGQTAVPLAVGEQFATKWLFREVIERELADYLRVDVCLVGGLTEARKIAGWAETHFIEMAPHNPLGPVCTAASLQLALATPNLGVLELPYLPGYLTDVFPRQVPYEAGYAYPPEAPGHGVTFDPEAAANYPCERVGKVSRFHRKDGSFTDH